MIQIIKSKYQPQDTNHLWVDLNDGCKLKIYNPSIGWSALSGVTEEDLNEISKRLDTLIGGNTSQAIDTFKEIEQFLSGITNEDSLTGLLNKLREDINKQLTDKVDVVAGSSLIEDTLIDKIRNLDKSDIGLGNVDNTSDLEKPISNSTQKALDSKVDIAEGKSLVSDTLISKLQNLYTKEQIDGELDGIKNSINDILGLEDLLSYGVEIRKGVADPHLYRIGNPELHKKLPIQNGYKGCIFRPKTKELVYWLDEDNWRYKKGYKDLRGADYTENLLLGSDVVAENQEYLTGSYSIVDQSLTDGESVTVTIWGELGSDRTVFVAYNSGGLVNLGPLTKVSDGVHKWTGKWKTKNSSGVVIANNTTLKIYAFPEATDPATTSKITKIKLERGTNANPIWTPAESETNNSILARLDGYDGEVMVYVPGFYYKSYDNGETQQVRISTLQIDSSWHYSKPCYVAAYRDTVLNTVPEDMGYLSTLEANSLISVVNTNSYCRGGNNDATKDTYLSTEVGKTLLGKCRTYLTRTNARTYARKAGKELISYNQYKNIFYWVWVIEYANFNSQEEYNPILTSEGYKQGGLGAGVTTLSDTQSNGYNGYYPITPCGYCNDLGNGIGTKDLTINIDDSTKVTFKVPRWRGFDNPFGDTWTIVDGIVVDANSLNRNNMDFVYTTDNPEYYGDSIGNMTLTCPTREHRDGYIRDIFVGDSAEYIPTTVGGSATTYKCDYTWCGDQSATLRIGYFGGRAAAGSLAGLGCFSAVGGVSRVGAPVGFRSICVI